MKESDLWNIKQRYQARMKARKCWGMQESKEETIGRLKKGKYEGFKPKSWDGLMEPGQRARLYGR
jgi:hypothetical protein